MLHRIQLTFGSDNNQPTIARTQSIVASIKTLYTYIGFAEAPLTLPVQPGEWYVTKDGTHMYAVFYIAESENWLTAEDLELLSTVLV